MLGGGGGFLFAAIFKREHIFCAKLSNPAVVKLFAFGFPREKKKTFDRYLTAAAQRDAADDLISSFLQK